MKILWLLGLITAHIAAGYLGFHIGEKQGFYRELMARGYSKQEAGAAWQKRNG